MTDTATDEQIIAWFAGMTHVNQFAAGLNPRDWAEAQTRAVPDQCEEFERRANVWREYMLNLADESPHPDHKFNPAPFCAKCGGPCEMPEAS